jgi:TRAP-type C4-dicarboxylate transport system permease small subunit
MRSLLDRIYAASCWLAAGCLAAICTLVVCQVALNLVDRVSTLLTGQAVGLTIPSYADFTGFLLAAASFLALAHTLRQGAHIRVALVISRLPGPMQRPVELWCTAFAFSITAYFTWYTAKLVHESFIYQDLSSGMIAVPIWIPQLFMLTGLMLLSIALLDEFVSVLQKRSPAYVLHGEKLLARDETEEKGTND